MELTGIGTVLRGLGDLYMLLAAVGIGLALYFPSGPKKKAIATVVVPYGPQVNTSPAV